jgi:hypothetical protein
MSPPRITRVETTAMRVVGPSVLGRIWAGDEIGFGACYPSGPATAIVAGAIELTECARLGLQLNDGEFLRSWHRKGDIPSFAAAPIPGSDAYRRPANFRPREATPESPASGPIAFPDCTKGVRVSLVSHLFRD